MRTFFIRTSLEPDWIAKYMKEYRQNLRKHMDVIDQIERKGFKGDPRLN